MNYLKQKRFWLMAILLVAGIIFVIDAAVLPLRDGQFPSLLSLPGWIRIIFIAMVAGAFGGVVGVVSLVELPDVLLSGKEMPTVPKWVSAAVLGVLGGSGGALAMLSVLINQSKITASPWSDLERVTLCSYSVIAGFLGTKLIQKLAEALSPTAKKQVQAVAQETANKEVDKMTTALSRITELNSLGVLLVETVLKLQVTPERTWNLIQAQEYIDRLERFQKIFPEHRQLAILLGRMYKEGLDKVEESIRALTIAITERDRQQLADGDTGDILYNRAAYYCKIAKKLADAAKQTAMYKDAGVDLSRSVKLNPKNIEEAKMDADKDFVDFKQRTEWPPEIPKS